MSFHSPVQREHMFDKVVTPSDVGKLNRLVIPKQHAQKYFPLDSALTDKGLLLNFEDRNGKPWRFRYSYWNSSQSYVMTKGWSRFVKEKKLDAGDVVSFQRGLGDTDKDRLFIDWRRRPDAPELPLPHHFSFQQRWTTPFFTQPAAAPTYNYHRHSSSSGYGNPSPPSIVYLRSGACGNRRAVEEMVLESVPVVEGKAASKRLRLFGVNMECAISESDECNSGGVQQRRRGEEKGKASMSLELDI